MGEDREKPVLRVPVAEILSGGLLAERKSPGGCRRRIKP
jgi:hypothetical protein